jgi:hypothetical protein
MPDRCNDGQFRTKAGRCVNTNPWVQWMVAKGGMGAGGGWPPSASYHLLTERQRNGLRNSSASSTHRLNDATAIGADRMSAFFSTEATNQDRRALSYRDGRVLDDGTVQHTLDRFPFQKHSKVHALCVRRLGWTSGNPDGTAPGECRSFTDATLFTILQCIDTVYFGSTFLRLYRNLRVAIVDDGAEFARRQNWTLPSFYAVFAPASNVITVNRRMMYRTVLPVQYEGVSHDTFLSFTIFILEHELAHNMCFNGPAATMCRQPGHAHGRQFADIITTAWAHGPPVAAAPISTVVLAAAPGLLICHEGVDPAYGRVAAIETSAFVRSFERANAHGPPPKGPSPLSLSEEEVGSLVGVTDASRGQRLFDQAVDTALSFRKRGIPIVSIAWSVSCVVGPRRKRTSRSATKAKRKVSKQRPPTRSSHRDNVFNRIHRRSAK